MTDNQNEKLAKKVQRLLNIKKASSYFQNSCNEDDDSVYYGDNPDKKVFGMVLTQKEIFNIFGIHAKEKYYIQVGPYNDPDYLTISSPIGQNYNTLNQRYLDKCFDDIEPLMHQNVKPKFIDEDNFYMDSINHSIMVFGCLRAEDLNDDLFKKGTVMLYIFYLIHDIEENLSFCRKELKK